MWLLPKNNTSAKLPKALSVAALLLLGTGVAVSVTSLHASGQSSPTPVAQASAFVGTWKAQYKGATYALLELRAEKDGVTGTVTSGRINVDGNGEVNEVTKAAEDADKQQVLDVDINRSTLAFRTIDGDGFQNYEFRTLGQDKAELKVIVPVGGGGPYLHPFPMTRELAKP
jgi:hypothetical protein